MDQKALWSVVICLFFAFGVVQSLELPHGRSKKFHDTSGDTDNTWRELLKLHESNAAENNRRPVVDAIKRALHDIFQNLLSSGFPTAVANSSIVSQQCIDDSILYVHSVFNFSMWALQSKLTLLLKIKLDSNKNKQFIAVKESSGNLPIGIFGSGNFHADGLFDECLAIRPPEAPYDGQYCTVFFRPERITTEPEVLPSIDERDINLVTLFQLLGLSATGQVEPKVSEADALSYAFPSISFCLPASCSAADLGYSIADLVGSFSIGNYSIVTVADERYCFKADKEPIKYDAPEITVM